MSASKDQLVPVVSLDSADINAVSLYLSQCVAKC